MPDQVGDEVHGSTTDQASNMKLAFESFEGSTCIDHKIQNALKSASKIPYIEKLEKACRGIVNHFRRSNKVRESLVHFFCITNIYFHLIYTQYI